MIISVRVIPKAGRNLVKSEEDKLRVYLTKPAQEGLANEQLVDLLCKYYKVRKYQVRIIKGLKSRDKLVEIDA